MKYIIAHDVGTSGSRSVLTKPDGTVVGSVVATYTVRHPFPGWAEQQPEDWWYAVCRSTRKLLQTQAVQPHQVLCITFSTQMLGIVPMNQGGQPLRSAIIWMDSRADAQAQQIMRRLFGSKIFTLIAGVAASGKDVVPKLLWLKQNEPELFNQTAKFLDVNGYLIYRCTGKMVTDWTSASATGLFDLKKKRWNNLLAGFVAIPTDRLPSLCRSTDIVAQLKPEAARDLGLLGDTPVVCGAGDVPTAAVGSGAVNDGAGHIYLGTSGWVGVVTEKRLLGKNGIATIQAAEANKNLLVAEIETTGRCLEWLASLLFHREQKCIGEDVYLMLDEAVTRVAAGADNLLFSPWLCGERSPVADVLVRSAFINLGLSHTYAHMVRAVYEGVAYNFRWILEIVQKHYRYRLDTLRVIGGGAQSDVWLQILADVIGKRIERVAMAQEAGAVGAALVAAVGLGIFADFQSVETVVNIDRTFQPSTADKQIYDQLFTVYKQLYAALKPIYHQMNGNL